MKNYHFFPVFLALLASYIGLHLYSASWFSRSFAVSTAAARNLRLLFLLLALFSPLTMFMRHRYTNPSLDWFYTAGYSWMGVIFLAGAGLIFADLLKLGLRDFLSPTGLQCYRYCVLTALGLIIVCALYDGSKAPAVKELRITVSGLPSYMEGLRIVQISDVHMDSEYKLRQFSDTIDSVNAAKPDLVLFTGDLVDPGLTDASSARLGELVRKLKPRLGVYGVLGNHEYYFGYERSLACYKKFGVNLLLNEAADITLSPNGLKAGGNIHIIGLSDILTEKMTEEYIRDILKKHHKPGVSILMTHQPLMYPLIAESGDFVGFSGHTHGGQIFPFHIFTRLFYKYFYGLYRFKNSVFYVTSGTGTWGPPMRWLAPSEIPMITLTGK